MKITINKITLLFFVTLLSCQSTNWQSSPPEIFQGTFTQVSDEIIQGYEKPIIIYIDDKEFNYNSYEDGFIRKCPILNVCKTDNHIIIFCGNKNENHIADYRYEMFWGTDNYLYISEFVDTGNNNDYAEFEIGKFTTYKYTVP